MISNLEANNQQHLCEIPEKQANFVSTMLKNMDIQNIFSITHTKPEFLTIFEEIDDQIDNCRHTTKFRIEDLMVRAIREVSDRRAILRLASGN